MMKPSRWYEGVAHCQQNGIGYVLVTVVSVAGSTPREAGSKMVVTGTESIDTIGGGHLEFDAIKRAREMLANQHCASRRTGNDANQPSRTYTHSYPLSSALGQCCGGAVKVLFDVCNLDAQHIAIFGAGHVAKALVPILAQLPVRISWIDNRASLFPEQVSDNVTVVVEEQPETEVNRLEDNTWLVVLTHDHQLDYRIVERALKYPALPFVGLIGSDTKAKRFTTKLSHRGFDEQALSRLVTPIGHLSIPGKRPIEVAVSISAQIITMLNSPPTSVAPGVEKQVDALTLRDERCSASITSE